ncbi:hypothetical protein E3E26_05390 [Thermococcus sp. LS1]|uniref:hypothetical protein n=1 Tax=Thermococcus sp. LS1 TaxID=1638259 RepID=UPI00143C84D2|nr:hypothetical protein [Thermococcus sp. LS1]NJD99214.1 hypothetical protein [Thermococcus sp. LS1]
MESAIEPEVFINIVNFDIMWQFVLKNLGGNSKNVGKDANPIFSSHFSIQNEKIDNEKGQRYGSL